MTKPFFGELRRKHRPAVWLQYRRSKHMSLLHVQLHRFQIDNQLHDVEFPTILFPVPAPSNSSKHHSKPAVELALLKKYSAHCNDVYKFTKLIIQEHSIQLERSWLAEMYKLGQSWWPEESASARMRHDIALVHLPISAIGPKVHFLAFLFDNSILLRVNLELFFDFFFVNFSSCEVEVDVKTWSSTSTALLSNFKSVSRRKADTN